MMRIPIDDDAYFQIPPERRAAHAVRGFHCPLCGALSGKECHVRGTDQPRRWPHRSRLKLARAQYGYPSWEADTKTVSVGVDIVTTPTGSGDGEELRNHYVWLLRRMLGNICPNDLDTPTMAALIDLLTPTHSRVVGGGDPWGGSKRRRDARILQLVPRSPEGVRSNRHIGTGSPESAS